MQNRTLVNTFKCIPSIYDDMSKNCARMLLCRKPTTARVERNARKNTWPYHHIVHSRTVSSNSQQSNTGAGKRFGGALVYISTRSSSPPHKNREWISVCINVNNMFNPPLQNIVYLVQTKVRWRQHRAHRSPHSLSCGKHIFVQWRFLRNKFAMIRKVYL